MPDFLDVRTWSILQWVLVVLAAGFIGQFGKSFAQFIIAKVKAGRTGGKRTAAPPATAAPGDLTPGRFAAPAGREEKDGVTNNAQAGRGDLTTPAENGGGLARDARSAREIISTRSGPPVPDKKALKAILKQEKKAAKASKK